MGNKIIELINKNIVEINQLISNEDYKNSFIKFNELYNKLKGVESEEGINYLLSNATSKNNRLLFSTIIGNLKKTDKIRFLFHLIYEQNLVDSIDTEPKENDKNIDKIAKTISNDRQIEKENIVKKISKIIQINYYITFIYYKSYLYELLAEKYFNLANLNYSSFIQENNDSLEDIQEIIDQFLQCKQNYIESKNYKKLIDVYEKAYDKVIEHKKLLTAFKKFKEKDYNEALKCFNEIKSNEPKMIMEKKYGINLCNEKLGEQEKENKNYEKALEYFTESKNNYQIFQLKLLINEIKIINCIKETKYEDSLIYFEDIFSSYNTIRISYDEKKYSDIFNIFIELMIKLALLYYEKKNIQKFKELIEETINKINNKETKIQIEELIMELNNIKSLSHRELYKASVDILLSENISEIKQRFYLSFLIINFFKENILEVSKFLLNAALNLNYLSGDAFLVIKNCLKETKIDCIEELFLLSKIFYKIIVNLGKFHKDTLGIIGDKLKELNKIPNLTKTYKLIDIMENLIYSFQEIMINNKNIKSYEGAKNLLLLIFTKNSNFINCITNGLVFLSQNKIIIDKKFLLKLKDHLIKNENVNLLQCLILQFKLQPLILSDDISIIFDILFFYQKLNGSKEKQKLIFEFLLSIDNEIISSKNSILNLEKYSKEGNIEPTFFILIEKIPLKSRGIYLTQQLLNYNENKNKNIIKIEGDDYKNQISFKLYFQKEDLPLAEKHLDDPKILEKLIYSLKQQKYLFKELNIENITKNYSSYQKELFNLLIENKVHFNEKSLINLLQGFYKNNENETKETFIIFNKIKEYENFSEIININLKIEKFLFNKEYLKTDNLNLELLEIINNFSFLFGFSFQHENYILYILDLPSHSNYQTIIDKMVELLIEKNFNIGVKIFKKILKTLNKEEFIELSSKILSNNNISYNIKNITLKTLYNIITKDKSKEYKIKIFKSFKFFIDKIKIPDILITYLISYLKKENNDDDVINKEIVFFLGIYFSITKPNQDKFLKEIILIYEKKELYQLIIKNVKSITNPNHIFYLFSNLYYYNFSLDEKKEEKILQLPKAYLIDFIKLNFKGVVNENFESNIIYMENYFKFDTFSPKRDEILRKLFFNDDKNAVNNLRLICH